jgi:leader peptidase (prepilin peptidase) / N-methyltransferase
MRNSSEIPVSVRGPLGGPICPSCSVASSVPSRLRGLLGRGGLPPGEGLLLLGDAAIHTFFMRFAIDAVFIDRELTVLKLVPGLRPWRVARCPGASMVLEVPDGAASGIAVGDRLVVDPPLRPERSIWSDALVVLVAAIAIAACLARFRSGGEAVVAAVLAAVLVVLAATDIRERRLPNRIVLPAAAVVLAGREVWAHSRWLEWAAAALAAFAALLAIHLVLPKALAMGDVKLALLLGAGLGWRVWPALALGYALGGLWAAGLLLRHRAAARDRTFALGPFLALGALIVLFLR